MEKALCITRTYAVKHNAQGMTVNYLKSKVKGQGKGKAQSNNNDNKKQTVPSHILIYGFNHILDDLLHKISQSLCFNSLGIGGCNWNS